MNKVIEEVDFRLGPVDGAKLERDTLKDQVLKLNQEKAQLLDAARKQITEVERIMKVHTECRAELRRVKNENTLLKEELKELRPEQEESFEALFESWMGRMEAG